MEKECLVMLSGLVNAWQNARLRQWFMSWRELSSGNRELVKRMLSAIGFLANTSVARSFTTWHAYSASRSDVHSRMSRVVGRMLTMTLSNAMRGWVSYRSHHLERMHVMSRVVDFWQMAAQRRWFMHWSNKSALARKEAVNYVLLEEQPFPNELLLSLQQSSAPPFV